MANGRRTSGKDFFLSSPGTSGPECVSAGQPNPAEQVTDREKKLAAIAELKRLREKHPLNGITIRELIEDGRRF